MDVRARLLGGAALVSIYLPYCSEFSLYLIPEGCRSIALSAVFTRLQDHLAESTEALILSMSSCDRLNDQRGGGRPRAEHLL